MSIGRIRIEVSATDLASGAGNRLRERPPHNWPIVGSWELADGASSDRLTFSADLAVAVRDAGFIQGSGPERLDLERDLFARTRRAFPADFRASISRRRCASATNC
jgi:hypothetical protein